MRKDGSILLSVIIILTSLLMFGTAVSSAVLSTTLKTQRAYQNMAALELAEAGINKAIWELNQGYSYTGESENTSLNDGINKGSFETTVSNFNLTTTQIVATGYVPNKANYKVKKTIRVRLTDVKSSSKGAFFYGVQLGDLGAKIENNAYIDGNVYGGGLLEGGNGSYVNGTAIMYNTATQQGTIRNVNVKNPASTSPPYIYNAWAHNIFDAQIYGDAKYGCADSTCFNRNTVKGISYPNSTDPTTILPSDWPIQDVDINGWKELAEAGGVLNGFSGTTIGLKKVNGNMIVDSTTTLNGIVWVTGNLEINGGATLKLDPSYGASSGLIVVDGQIHLGNGAIIAGSGNPKSSIMLLSTKVNNSLLDPVPAILVDNGAIGAVFYAKDGYLKLSNTANARSYAGKGLYLAQNSFFRFEEGVRNPNFMSGPGGIFAIADWQIIY